MTKRGNGEWNPIRFQVCRNMQKYRDWPILEKSFINDLFPNVNELKFHAAKLLKTGLN